MSRVRILNLPQDCTEALLRQHILRTAPASAPPLDITDVAIIRSAAPAPHNKKDHKPAKAQAGHTQVPSHEEKRQGRIRMAFVGFHNVAAAQFVVKYFNQTYFRSAKLLVELAKAPGEVGTTVNQQRKQEKAAAAKEKTGKRAREAEKSPSNSMNDDKDARVHKAARVERNSASTIGTTSETPETAKGAADTALEARKATFIAERTKATAGPSWAADVLVPDDDNNNNNSAVVAAQADGEASGVHAVDGTSNVGKAHTAVHAAMVPPITTSLPSELTPDTEEAALAKQQALGAVSDLDFLAQLAGGAQASAAAGDAKRNEADTQEKMKMKKTTMGGEHEAQSTGQANTAQTLQDNTKDEQAGEDEEPTQEDIARDSRRVRLGGIAYIATEEQVKQFASSLVGPVEAVHIPLTRDTKQSKGAAFVTFVHAEDAVRALSLCAGHIFMGRLLRVSAATVDPYSQRAMERAARQGTSAAANSNTATGGDGGGENARSMAGSSQYKIAKAVKLSEEQGGQHGAAGQGHVMWNTMYMNSHAAVTTVAGRLGVKAEDVVNVQGRGAAVRAAIAEAYLANEVQQVLGDEGIDFDILQSAGQNVLKPRSSTTILVKNLQLHSPADAAELTRRFVRFGPLESSAFPSAGVFALFRFVHAQDARVAFTRLSFKLFQNAPLYLEWAPVGATTDPIEPEAGGANTTKEGETNNNDNNNNSNSMTSNAQDEAGTTTSNAAHVVLTLFITNLPFDASEDDFYTFLLDTCPRLARAPDAHIQRLVYQKDQGRAFLTVRDMSTFTYCKAKLNGRTFNDRVLSCVVSKQTAIQQQQQQQQHIDGSGGEATALVHDKADVAGHDMRTSRGGGNDDDDYDDAPLRKTSVRATMGSSSNNNVPPGCDPRKLIVKNLPFEATEKDVRELFGAFSEIRSVRVPRKSHVFASHRENNHRGFAFVEFLSETEAARAMQLLRSTHLYGRHLVLQYAKLDA